MHHYTCLSTLPATFLPRQFPSPRAGITNVRCSDVRHYPQEVEPYQTNTHTADLKSKNRIRDLHIEGPER